MSSEGQKNSAGMLEKLFRRMSLTLRLILDRRVEWTYKFIPLATLIYIISPIDIAPEIIFGPLGVIDDLGIFLLGLETFIRLAPKEVVQEHLNRLGASHEPTKGPQATADSDVIEGEYVVHHSKR
jgi:uncharacterized membrane protein YkvA (DUF1232 family)